MQKTPHFFKAKSKIGLINPPIGKKEFNIGVEEAPDFILDGRFISHFKGAEISEFIFSKPEEIGTKNYYSVLSRELLEFKNLINQNIRSNQIQVVLGGDNSITLASILAVLERIDDPESLGYIQFDSHGEMNSYSGSESKNFHGMYMRAILDKFEIAEIEKIAQPKIGTNQIITIGDLSLDGDEPEFFRKNKIRNINRIQITNYKLQITNELQKFIRKYKHIHINFDVDIFDKSISPATGLADDGKWLWEEVLFILEIIKRNAKNFSIDTCEINPKKKDSKKTIKVAQEILKKMLS